MRRDMSFALALALVLIAACSAQDQLGSVYGSMNSKRILMAEFRANLSFFMILDTLEYRGAYARPNASQIRFTCDDGTALDAALSQDTLRVEDKTLIRWDGGTSAASYLSAFLKFRVLITKNRADIVNDLVQLARAAKRYRDQTGAFTDFTIVDGTKEVGYATYSAKATTDQIVLKGTSTQVEGAVQITVLADGKPTAWTYFKHLQ